MESEKTSKKYKIDEKSLEYLDFEHACDVIVAHSFSDRFGFVDSNFSGELKELVEEAVNVLHETIGDKVVLGACINLDDRFIDNQYIDLLVADFNESMKVWIIEMWRLRFFAE
jgi:hypothetical protein